MTTYPLSEQATVYAVKGEGAAEDRIVGQGTLDECAEIVGNMAPPERRAVRIEMGNLDLRFGPDEIDELLRFLRDEGAGLSNREIAAITDPDR